MSEAATLQGPDPVREPGPLREPSPLREPWDDIARQREAASFGMWLFLMSELLFFGALLIAFAYARTTHPQAFVRALQETDLALGTLNTALLATSSLMITLAVRTADAGRAPLTAAFLAATVALGAAFLVLKGFEYHKDFVDHLVPGEDFRLGRGAEQLFFGFYWITTGLHAIHLTIGLGLVGRLSLGVARGSISPASPQVEVTSLYWHLVDAFWVVLYPLLYLAGRGA